MLAIIVVFGLCGARSGAADAPLQLLYQDRLPYYTTAADGSVGGLVAGPVSKALRRAGIAVSWKVRPGKRQIETIRNNRAAACSPGWFKKPEREKFAKFSNTIYQDRPQVVIIRTTDLVNFKFSNLAALFAARHHTFGAKLAYSYGGFVDDLIAEVKPKVQRTPQDVQGMVHMLVGRRFDYMLAAQEEFRSLQANLPTVSDGITAVQMKDIPPGNKRYLMCSKKVGDDIMRRFNDALAALPR